MDELWVTSFLNFLVSAVVESGNKYLNFVLVPNWDFRVWHLIMIPFVASVVSALLYYILGFDFDL